MNVLFDLDGTLTDPGAGITRCLQHALAVLGRPVPAAESLRSFVGPPLARTMAELLGTRDEALLAEAVRLYRERFVETGLFENAVYYDVPDGLETLTRRGHRLWLATSKPHPYARRILDHFGLARWFSGVYGSELSGENAEKGDLIRHLLAAERLPAGEACMVGDREHDVRGGRANGLATVAVLWGYGTEEELAAARPDHTVRSMAELCACLGAAATA